MGKRVYRREPEVKSPPALKHGAFSAAKILPGEDPKEFAKLLADVKAELRPSGPIEDEYVLSIACALWRKRRLAIFQKAAHARKLYGPIFEHADKPGWDEEAAQLRHMMNKLKDFREVAQAQLEARDSIHEFESGVDKIADTVCELLDKSRKEFEEEDKVLYALAKMGDTATPEHLVKLLELEERLDATLERSIKRLMQFKSMKVVVLQLEPHPV